MMRRERAPVNARPEASPADHEATRDGAVVTAPPATTVSASIALLFQTRAVTAGQLSEFRRALEVEAAQLAAIRRSHAPDARAAIVAHFDQLERVLRDLGLGDRTLGSSVLGDPVAPADMQEPRLTGT